MNNLEINRDWLNISTNVRKYFEILVKNLAMFQNFLM